MPVYDYSCPTCGPFEALMPMARCKDPVTCGACGATAPRVLLTAPALANMGTGRRRAHETNERAADSPKKSSHGPGCSCCGGSKKINSGTLQRPDGSKSFPKKRPWMISH